VLRLERHIGLAGEALNKEGPVNVGQLSLMERRADGTLVWRLQGQAGFRYLVEKRVEQTPWKPLQVIENVTGEATFTDANPGDLEVVLYRARILD
jgi:hypothetical protein